MKLKDFASNLWLHESLHFISALLLFAFVFWLYGKISLAAIAFLVSFLIDADHFFESIIIYRFNLDSILKKTRCNSWRESGKMTILFHSWELVLVLLVLGWQFNFMPLSIAICLSASVHYLIDTLIYSLNFRMPVSQYFLLYRAYYKFDFLTLYYKGKGNFFENEKK